MGKFILHTGHIRTRLQTGKYRSRKEKAFSGFGLKNYILFRIIPIILLKKVEITMFYTHRFKKLGLILKVYWIDILKDDIYAGIF